MSQAQANETKAFDFIAEGVGYLNRIRDVKPAGKARPYLACTINVMMGTADAVEYVSVDCKVVGKVAAEAIKVLRPHVEAKKKVIVGCRVGDPRPEFYEVTDRESGESRRREGLKARLLQLTFAKVDGQKVEIPLVAREGKPDLHDDSGIGSACEDASAPAMAA